MPGIVAESARTIEFVGRSDQGGRGDGVQVMVHHGYAYVGTRVSRGVNVTDVRNPRNPKPVGFLPLHKNSWCMHLQTAENLMLVIQELDMKALMTAQEYYGGSLDRTDSARFGIRGQDYAAGMRVYDISASWFSELMRYGRPFRSSALVTASFCRSLARIWYGAPCTTCSALRTPSLMRRRIA